MFATRTLRALTLAVVLAANAGCYTRARAGVGVEFVVREPPVERVEVVPASPGGSAVWIKGHWGWRNNDYVWVGGRWEVPAAGYRAWEPGHWAHENRGWYWIEGHWVR